VSKQNSILDLIDTYRILWKAVHVMNTYFRTIIREYVEFLSDDFLALPYLVHILPASISISEILLE